MPHSGLRLHSNAPSYATRLACTLLIGAFVAASARATASEHSCNRPIADAMPLIEKMEHSWDRVADYTAYLHKTERFADGRIIEERGFIKFRKPDQIYLRLLEGANAGAELLFPKPGTDRVVLARPGGVTGAIAGFLASVPAIGRLIPHEFDLHDARLLVGQHHPLPDSSLAKMIRLISLNVSMAARRAEGSMCFHASEHVDGKPTTKFEVHLPPEVGFSHTIAEGETLWSIADHYAQDRYVIVYSNPSLNAEAPLPAGARIFVPRYYAPRALIWVSQAIHLPLRLQMFDVDRRLYEAYSNVDLRIDVGMGDEDFDPVAYGFPAETTPDDAPSVGSSPSR